MKPDEEFSHAILSFWMYDQEVDRIACKALETHSIFFGNTEYLRIKDNFRLTELHSDKWRLEWKDPDSLRDFFIEANFEVIRPYLLLEDPEKMWEELGRQSRGNNYKHLGTFKKYP